MSRLPGLLAMAAATAAAAGGPSVVMAHPRAEAYAVNKTATGGGVVLLYGEPAAEYVVDRANKPFLWRIAGPTGTPMTRAFPTHQRGLGFGHQDVAGFDTWAEDASHRDHPALEAWVETVGAIRSLGYLGIATLNHPTPVHLPLGRRAARRHRRCLRSLRR